MKNLNLFIVFKVLKKVKHLNYSFWYKDVSTSFRSSLTVHVLEKSTHPKKMIYFLYIYIFFYFDPFSNQRMQPVTRSSQSFIRLSNVRPTCHLFTCNTVISNHVKFAHMKEIACYLITSCFSLLSFAPCESILLSDMVLSWL